MMVHFWIVLHKEVLRNTISPSFVQSHRPVHKLSIPATYSLYHHYRASAYISCLCAIRSMHVEGESASVKEVLYADFTTKPSGLYCQEITLNVNKINILKCTGCNKVWIVSKKRALEVRAIVEGLDILLKKILKHKAGL